MRPEVPKPPVEVGRQIAALSRLSSGGYCSVCARLVGRQAIFTCGGQDTRVSKACPLVRIEQVNLTLKVLDVVLGGVVAIVRQFFQLFFENFLVPHNVHVFLCLDRARQSISLAIARQLVRGARAVQTRLLGASLYWVEVNRRARGVACGRRSCGPLAFVDDPVTVRVDFIEGHFDGMR